MSDAAKSKAKQKWAIEKPKLDKARQMRRIQTHHGKTLVGSWKFRCQQQCLVKHQQIAAGDLQQYWETQNQICLCCRCRRIYEHRYQEDYIAAKGINSQSHYNLVHKFIPMPQALNMPDAKAAVEKEWETLEKIAAWQLTKDLCHLKNSELNELGCYARTPHR